MSFDTKAQMNMTGPQLFLASVSLCLLIATAVSSLENQSIVLYFLLAAILVFSFASAALETSIRKYFCDDSALTAVVDNGLKPTWASMLLIIAPSTSLSILLLVRLLSIEHFSTNPAALNFGFKQNYDANVSFEGGSAFGHWIQGVIATVFAYPAVTGVLSRLCRGKPLLLAPPRSWVLLLGDFASFAFTFYPSYNFVKRMVRTPETFATSSYMNNGCEWAFGSIVGVSVGMLLTSITKWRVIEALRQANWTSSESYSKSYPFAKVESIIDERLVFFSWVCRGVARMFGVLFLASVIAAAAVMGITWNNCEKGGEDCTSFEMEEGSPGLIIGLVMIPTAVIGVCLLVGRQGPEEIRA